MIMIYYNSRYLSDLAEINLAKWKRWVREFLPPDPLGGMQSGYARQLNLKDAFQVYLGGHLVQSLKFSVAEARSILFDLQEWLQQNGFFALTVNNFDFRSENVILHRLYIVSLGRKGFGYVIRSSAASTANEDRNGQFSEKYALTLIKLSKDPVISGDLPSARIVGLTRLYGIFLDMLQRN
jgi:hypothetical protein